MISYGKQNIGDEEINAVVEVLKSDWLTQGPTVEKFELNLTEYFGSKYCTAVSNGTAALHLTGIALGWGKGDIILTTPNTFLATANSIIYSGATPYFIDIDEYSYNIDIKKIEVAIKKLNNHYKSVKAIIAVDYAGHPCDWESLRNIADKYNLQLINDNCHAVGAAIRNNKQYAIKYADVVTQSYHPVKNITTGEGGAILTNCDIIHRKVQSLRTHVMVKDKTLIRNDEGRWYYEMQSLGFNYRITDLQCAIGIQQLLKLDEFIKEKQKIANYYNQMFSGKNLLSTPKVNENVFHAYHLYPLIIDFDNAKVNKKYLYDKMNACGIGLQVHYIPIHLQPYYMQKFGYKIGDFPIAENFYKNEVSMPIYPHLTKKDQKFVIEKLFNYLEI